MKTFKTIRIGFAVSLAAFAYVAGCAQSSAPKPVQDGADSIIDQNAASIEKERDKSDATAGLSQCQSGELVGYYSATAKVVPCTTFTEVCSVTKGATPSGNPAQCPLKMNERSGSFQAAGSLMGYGAGSLAINFSIGFDVTSVTKDSWNDANMPPGQRAAGNVTTSRTVANEHTSISLVGMASDGLHTMDIDGRFKTRFDRTVDFCERVPVTAVQCGG
jgi:hypothetical protein